jgi:hypothetical protein
MARDIESGDEFAVFAVGDRGPVWKDLSLDYQVAKIKAQELADREGVECFVFAARDAREVARFFPRTRRVEPGMKAPRTNAFKVGLETTIEITAEMARWARQRRGWVMRPAQAGGCSATATMWTLSQRPD